MSRHHRLVAVGTSLAVAGIFITAPARAATTTNATAGQTAQAQGHGFPGARPASAEPGYKSFSSSAKSAGRTTVRSRASLPEQAKPAAASAATIYVLADPNHCYKKVGAGTYDDPYCLLQSAVNAATHRSNVPGVMIRCPRRLWQETGQDREHSPLRPRHFRLRVPTAQDYHLVPQREYLRVLGRRRTGEQHQPGQHRDQQPVDQGDEHGHRSRMR